MAHPQLAVSHSVRPQTEKPTHTVRLAGKGAAPRGRSASALLPSPPFPDVALAGTVSACCKTSGATASFASLAFTGTTDLVGVGFTLAPRPSGVPATAVIWGAMERMCQ